MNYCDKTYKNEGWIMIDRCGKHFGSILSFLRDGSLPLPDSKRELLEILKVFLRIGFTIYIKLMHYLINSVNIF